jgi:hypothetical protein
MRSGPAIGLISLAACLAACGNGSNGSTSSSSSSSSAAVVQASGPNAQAISVNAGPQQNYANGVFTSVTLCVPGTSDCQQINNVLVDTGSFGLRILASAVSLPLPEQTDESGNPIGECALFVDSFTWGPVATADVAIASEKAYSVPVQVIGPADFPPPPAGCLSSGLQATDTTITAGSNGFLGIGVFPTDCGTACASAGPSNPGFYYSCPQSGCQVTAESVANQVRNPVVSFSADNNGELVELPTVGANGASTASGALVFGIGTETNNGLGSAKVFTTNDFGDITAVYAGNFYPSYIDSGSNGIFFLSSAATGIAGCPAPDAGFYCPSKALQLTAEIGGTNGAAASSAFSIANAQQLFSTGNAAYNNLGGPNPHMFDWGLPFFFGRHVFVAIDGQDTPAGPGPYYAY